MPLDLAAPYPEISVKWPAARLLGTQVSVELHREYVLKTDSSFVGEGFTNNRVFENELNDLIGLKDYAGSANENYRHYYRRKELFSEELGHISLNYLGSHWISNSFIGGPHGVVAPSGIVQTARNFGKYPTVSEIESDLTALSLNFPTLEFTLSIWGHIEESDYGLPSHTWKLTANQPWSREEPSLVHTTEPDVLTTFMQGMNNPNREQTYTLNQIKSLWGDKLSAARHRMEDRYTKEFT